MPFIRCNVQYDTCTNTGFDRQTIARFLFNRPFLARRDTAVSCSICKISAVCSICLSVTLEDCDQAQQQYYFEVNCCIRAEIQLSNPYPTQPYSAWNFGTWWTVQCLMQLPNLCLPLLLVFAAQTASLSAAVTSC